MKQLHFVLDPDELPLLRHWCSFPFHSNFFLAVSTILSVGNTQISAKLSLQFYFSMSKIDQQYFHCDIFRFNAIDYSRDYVLGLRTYLAREPFNEQHINGAKRRYMILRLISYVRSMFYYGVLGYLLYMFMRVCNVTYYFELMRG